MTGTPPLAAEGAPLPPRWLSLLRVVHPFPSVLVAALTVAIIPLADRHAERAMYLQLGLGMLLYQVAIGLANDVADATADRSAKPWKAIPRGLIGRRAAAAAAATCAVAGLALTAGLGWRAWCVGAGGLACGLAYDVYLKRTPVSWLPFAIALPLIPTWVFVATGRWEHMLWWAFPLAGILGLALHLANQAPDASQPGAGLVGTLGEPRSRRYAVALFVLAALGAAAVLASDSLVLALIAAWAAGLVVAASPRATAWLGRDGLFGLLAVAGGALAVLFLSAV